MTERLPEKEKYEKSDNHDLDFSTELLDQEYYQREYEKLQNNRFEQETKMRYKYASKVFNFLYSFSIFSAVIILLQGFGHSSNNRALITYFHISNTSLSILIGSTTISIIGLVAIVLKGLFPNK